MKSHLDLPRDGSVKGLPTGVQYKLLLQMKTVYNRQHRTCDLSANSSTMFLSYKKKSITIRCRQNPFPKKPWGLCVCSTSLLKTLREKEDKQSLLFPQCFLPIKRSLCHFHQILNCHLQTRSVWKCLKFVILERPEHLLNLDQSKILSFLKWVTHIKTYWMDGFTSNTLQQREKNIFCWEINEQYLTHSLVHHFDTVQNLKKKQKKKQAMTTEMWLLKDFKKQIAQKTLWKKVKLLNLSNFTYFQNVSRILFFFNVLK